MNRKLISFRSNEFRLRNSAPVAGRICDIILLRHSAIPPEGLMNRKLISFRSNEFRLRNSAPVAGRICDTILLRHSAIPPEGS